MEIKPVYLMEKTSASPGSTAACKVLTLNVDIVPVAKAPVVGILANLNPEGTAS